MRFAALAVAFVGLATAACSGGVDSKFDPNARIGGSSSDAGPATTDSSKATQTGVITDFGSGDPVVGATVKANDATAVTDAKGRYSLQVPKGEVFSMEVTAPQYVSLIEQQTLLTADYDRGPTTIVPLSMSTLLHDTLNGYDKTLGILTVAVLPAAGCASVDGATITVEDAPAAKVKYMIGKMPSNTLTSVKAGEFPSAVVYNLPVGMPITLKVESASCAQAAFPFANGAITYEASVATQPDEFTSFQRLFLGASAK